MLDKRNFYINGKWIKPSKKNDLNVINPSTEESFATISLGNKEDVNIAVEAASCAFQSWSLSNKSERISLFKF